MELNHDILVESLIWGLVFAIALRLSFMFGKSKGKKRNPISQLQRVEPQIELDIDAVRTAEMKNQLNMLDEFDGILHADISDEEKLERINGRLKYYRRYVTFFFDN